MKHERGIVADLDSTAFSAARARVLTTRGMRFPVCGTPPGSWVQHGLSQTLCKWASSVNVMCHVTALPQCFVWVTDCAVGPSSDLLLQNISTTITTIHRLNTVILSGQRGQGNYKERHTMVLKCAVMEERKGEKEL
ncbi:hypothetical protein RRG08_025145 [Elysia crispata]|uniref:Uncharacterized protein n=1 Tax=Elysia crispata TaxID=231223 RepID=A0AAE1CVB6_9GAST|nr:hypothetical protein RRG08_025145 [Elysia crispata]